jgi:hypothetical protein
MERELRRVTSVIRTDVLFHYTLRPGFDPTAVFRKGLLPLSSLDPVAADASRGTRRELYVLFAAPVLGPHGDRHSGIFLTPIDFNRIRGDGPNVAWIKSFGRFQVPLTALESPVSVVTWGSPFPRTSLALSSSALAEAAHLWSSGLILQWFGRDRSRMFFHVPQVVTFQDVILVAVDQWQPPGQWR